MRFAFDEALASDEATRPGVRPAMLGPMVAAATSSAHCVVTVPSATSPTQRRSHADYRASVRRAAEDVLTLSCAVGTVGYLGSMFDGSTGQLVGAISGAVLWVASRASDARR